jgi:hypothetical protein
MGIVTYLTNYSTQWAQKMFLIEQQKKPGRSTGERPGH